MRIERFRIANCFGFGNESEIIFDSKTNLYTVLGRNSSGKTSLLDAIKSLEINPQEPPNQYKRYNNFGSKEEGYIEAEFEIKKTELSVEKLSEEIIEKIEQIAKEQNVNLEALYNEQTYNDMISSIKEQYDIFFKTITNVISIRKSANGNYLFSSNPGNYDEAKQRIDTVKNIINQVYIERNGNRYASWAEHYDIALNFSAEEIENLLFMQFPNITYFEKENSLIGDFPDRITNEDIIQSKFSDNELVNNFITYLGEENVKAFLEEEDPDKLNFWIKNLNSRAKQLETIINNEICEQDLIKIILSSNNGLQITFKVDDKPCYYRLLSENTQLYFGYHLFCSVNNFKEDIILLDEPNSGFHASVQSGLKTLLSRLASDGNIVIFTTHSEYMIDPNSLSGVKLMAKDEENRLYIRNHFSDQPKQSGDYLALQPLMTAIGLQIGNNFNAKQKIIITEGITDMYYLLAFSKILNQKRIIDFAPARGDSTILNVLPLIISQGISFKVISDTNPKYNVSKQLEISYGVEPKYYHDIPIPKQHKHVKDSGIEDAFTQKDFLRLLDKVNPLTEKERQMFKNDSNLHIIKAIGKNNDNLKRIIAFYLYSNKDKYKETDFDKKTLENFRNVLNFCINNNWKKI